MANTFKVVNFAAEPASSGSPYVVYTAASSTNNTANGTSVIVKDAPIPVGSALELMAGNKVVLEATDQITVDCSVADKLSGTLSIMEIT